MPLFLAKGISEMSSVLHFLISPMWGWLVVRWDLLSGQKCSDGHFPHLLPKGRLLGHFSWHCTSGCRRWGWELAYVRSLKESCLDANAMKVAELGSWPGSRK